MIAMDINSDEYSKFKDVENNNPEHSREKSPEEDQAPGQNILESTSKKTGNGCTQAHCLSWAYNIAGNLSLAGAFIGAGLLTTASLNDRQKDGVGGLTMGLIALGAICFWNLAYCTSKNKKMDLEESSSKEPSIPFANKYGSSN